MPELRNVDLWRNCWTTSRTANCTTYWRLVSDVFCCRSVSLAACCTINL